MSQNSSTSNSNARRYLIGFVTGLALLLLPGTFTAYYMGPAQGDLSRIGRLGERYFVMSQPQAPLLRRANPPAAPADVLVIGDSFAAENVWQSHLSHLSGLTTSTYHYDDVECIDQWIRDAIGGAISRSAKVVILSTVERKFLSRYGGELEQCHDTGYAPRSVPEQTLPVAVSPYALFPMDIRYVFNTVRHHHMLTTKSGRHTLDNTVVVDLIRDDLFSNTLSGKLLYFSNDDSSRQKEWSPQKTQQAINNLKRYEQLAKKAGIQLVVFVIPDKSTVYAPWIKEKQFPEIPGYNVFETLAEQFGASADLRNTFRERASKTRDFYAPNDSHPSLEGYRFIGELMAARIARPED